MARKALLIGLNEYDHVSNLSACASDAQAMADVLRRNADGSINFDCRVLTSPGPTKITRAELRRQWSELFANVDEDVLFYFSGHGSPTDLGGYLVTQDGKTDDPGLRMNDVVELANNSKARTVLVILDCCFSGAAGNPSNLGTIANQALLREGVTILAASRSTEVAWEIGGHGVFTKLLLGALSGAAADVRGKVSAAAMYAYAEAALGAWDQRPLYKSHAAHLHPVRRCDPRVPDELLRQLPTYFPSPEFEYQLNPRYEETNVGAAEPQLVEVFKKFKQLQLGGLLRPKSGTDLYWSAERSGLVVLTTLGQFYWDLVSRDRI